MDKDRQPTKITFFSTVWWTIATIAGATVLVIAWEALAPACWPRLPDGRATLLPGLLIGLGILLALMTFRRDTTNQHAESQLKSDQLAFEAARDSLRQAVDLIRGFNNDRATWVNAARLLLKAQELAQQIHTGVVGDAMQIELAKTRYELFSLLQCDTKDESSKQCLPPSFFLGIADWEHVEEGPEALKKTFADSDNSTTSGWIGMNVINPEPTLNHLAASSVVAVYDFISDYSNADNPLANVTVWDDEEMDIMPGFDQGARQYVNFVRRHVVIDGKVKEINRSPHKASE